VRAVAVHGGPVACHFVVRDVDGGAWLFGRSTAGALGPGTSGVAGAASENGNGHGNGGKAKAKGKKTKGADEPALGEGAVSESAPYRVRAGDLPGGRRDDRIVHAACGRAHTLLVGSSGAVWAAGANAVGQVRSTYFVVRLALKARRR
jgi:alpha-tubulin suppressor-like RCC1 family protein